MILLEYGFMDREKTVPKIGIPLAVIEEFCRKWKISEFALFGSILRDDFTPQSDVDALVTFSPESGWSLWDLVDMQNELSDMFHRKVDLVERAGLRNPFRRKHILDNMSVIYAA